MQDLEYPSPDRNHLALAYSVAEIRMGWEVGALALFRGPREHPRPLLSHWEISVMPHGQKAPWLSDRFFAATAYMWDGKERVELPLVVLDVESGTLAYYPLMNSYICDLSVVPEGWQIAERERDNRFASHHGEMIGPSKLQWFAFADAAVARSSYWSGSLGRAT
jgi:hypothetical protein